MLCYTKWDSFLNVVSKARTACEVSGREPGDHFVYVNKMVDLGSDSQREIDEGKKATMETYWSPGVDNLKTYDRWTFAEFCDVYEMEADFEAKVEVKFNKMIEQVTCEED